MTILRCATVAFREGSARYIVSAIKGLSDFHEIRYWIFFYKTLSRQYDFHEIRRNDSRTLLRGVTEFLPVLSTFN
jgi:hypothetical protein